MVFGTVNVHQTMQACVGHRTMSIPPDRHIPSSRRDPFAQRGVSRLTRYNPSLRLLSRRMKWRSTVPTIARPSTYIPQVPPDTNPPRHGASVPPGSPLASHHWGTPVISNPHPHTPKFGGPACMRPGARGTFAVTPVSECPRRSRSPGSPSQPQVKAGVGSRSRECPRVCQGSTDVPPIAGGRVYGETCGMSVDVRGIICRRFLCRASS